jgi:hypothetical protein
MSITFLPLHLNSNLYVLLQCVLHIMKPRYCTSPRKVHRNSVQIERNNELHMIRFASPLTLVVVVCFSWMVLAEQGGHSSLT